MSGDLWWGRECEERKTDSGVQTEEQRLLWRSPSEQDPESRFCIRIPTMMLTVNPSDIFSYSRCSLFGWSPSKPSWQVPGTPQASYPTLCSCTLIPGANVVYSIKLMCICLLCGRQPDFSTYWSENSGGTQRCGLVSSFLIASSDCRPFRCSAAAPCWSYS